MSTHAAGWRSPRLHDGYRVELIDCSGPHPLRGGRGRRQEKGEGSNAHHARGSHATITLDFALRSPGSTTSTASTLSSAMSALGPAERARIADRLERSTRHLGWGLAPLTLFAVVDLLTGWFTDDRRLDPLLLIAAAMGFWGLYSVRRLARRIRAGEPKPPTRRSLLLALAALAATLTLTTGMGYLVGGSVGAVVLPSATIALLMVSFAIGILRRQRIQSGR
jgi:hypothetical protein